MGTSSFNDDFGLSRLACPAPTLPDLLGDGKSRGPGSPVVVPPNEVGHIREINGKPNGNPTKNMGFIWVALRFVAGL